MDEPPAGMISTSETPVATNGSETGVKAVLPVTVAEFVQVADTQTATITGELAAPREEVSRQQLIVLRELESVRSLPAELVEQLAELMALRGSQHRSNIAPGIVPDRALLTAIEDAIDLTAAVGDQLSATQLSKASFKVFYRAAKEVAEDIEWWSERAKNISGNVAQTASST